MHSTMTGRGSTASDAAQLVADLVAIDSVNPDLVAGGAGEARIAAFVASWLSQAGLEVWVEDTDPARPSVVATARGRGTGRTLLLNAHLDTVGHGGMANPLVPRVDGGRLYGRGSYDMKGGLAAIMLAGADALQCELAGDVVIAAVSDEESLSTGMRSVLATLAADAAVVTEPTGLQLCIAHKGFVWADVTTRGTAAHGSRPDLGRDAIVAMGHVLTALGALDERLAAGSHPLLGRGSVHAGTISGGAGASTYPGACRLEVERRTLPGEDATVVAAELTAVLEAARAAHPALDASLELLLVREPLGIDPQHPLVEGLRRCAEDVLGRKVALVGEHPWTDGALLAAAGIPTVVFGPGGQGAHADVEWVQLADVERCRHVLARFAEAFCDEES